MTVSPPPTLAGFTAFVTNYMQVPGWVLEWSVTTDAISTAFQVAQELVNCAINLASPVMFTLATYNLAAANLVTFAPDQKGKPYWSRLRKKFGLNSFTAGVVEATAEESTSVTLATPESLKNLMIADLQNLKSPWGVAYLEIAQRYGPLWGLS